MYHKNMTIKRRLFVSNIRMVFIAFFAFGLAARIAAFLVIGEEKPDYEALAHFRDIYSRDTRLAIWFLIFALLIILVSLINGFLTHRMTKRITKPLKPLTEGARQIEVDNLAYRIDYQNEDEFHPVCEAFNNMAARLEASAQQRLKDETNRRELLVGISHDLSSPLTAIDGYLDGIKSGVASTPEMREEYFNTIKSKIASMKHIIAQLFLFSKLDMDEFPFSPHHFDIICAISDMVEELAEDYAKQGLNITIADCPKNVYVNADAAHLRRVLINIFENSVKYKEKETGSMEISAALIENSILIKFADDGPGVNPDALPDLFNVFYRTDPSRHTSGSGLGLAISAKIIERSGGSIYAENGIAGGLTVAIRLPVETGAI